MSVTAKWFRNALVGQYGTTAGRRINWTGDTIKVTLHTVTYVPAQDTNTFQSDVTNEITGTGYTAGGVTLAGKAVTLTTPDVILSASNAVWTTATFTARRAVVADTTPGTAATNPLVSYVDFGADQSVSAGTFTIAWAADGVAKHTVS